MPIIQHDPTRPNETISVDSARLVIAPFEFPGGKCLGASLDLTPYQGGPVRIYVELDGSVTVATHGDHFWLLAEATLPTRRYESETTSQVDEHGQPATVMVERPLNLNDVDITVFPIPEVE